MRPLDPALWRRVEAAFDRLLDLTGSAREVELGRISAEESELRAHLDALLLADARSDGPLENPVAALVDSLAGKGEDEVEDDD